MNLNLKKILNIIVYLRWMGKFQYGEKIKLFIIYNN